jgi:WD40 repeat protein
MCWTPYVPRPTWTLEGHADAIIELCFNESRSQLISVAGDKTVKVWDVRKLQCVQTLTDTSLQMPVDRLRSAAFDVATQRLVRNFIFVVLPAWCV